MLFANSPSAMKTLLQFFLSLAVPLSATGAGFVTIDGKLGGGWEVVIQMEPPPTIHVWQRTKSGDLVHPKTYEDQGCVMTAEVSERNRETRTLTCPSSGSSPVAGTRYVGKRFKGNCWKGAPEFVYTCVAGCGKGSKAPQVLHQDYWEC
jgi:hypothetical protein